MDTCRTWRLFLTLVAMVTAVLAEVDQDNDPFEYDGFDGMPGVTFEFKVEIAAGSRECLHQKVKYGSQFVANFEVIQGADRSIDMVILRPDRELLDRHMWVRNGITDKIIDMPGEYTVCLDNTRSRFSAKLVYFRLGVVNLQELEQYATDVEEVSSSLGNLGQAMANMTTKILKMRRQMGMFRSSASGDYYLASTNNRMVQYWSGLMSALICVTSLVQVYFVRKMFRTVNVTPTTHKPRA